MNEPTPVVETPDLYGAYPRLSSQQIEMLLTRAAAAGADRDGQRNVGRPAPLLLETSRLGVFAAGDVGSGSVKRVASGVGEGAMAVRLICPIPEIPRR